MFDSSILADIYRGKNATTTYTLNVIEDNTLLDVSLRSPDITGAIYLYGPNGSKIDGSAFYRNYNYLINKVNKGQYKLVVEPGNGTSGVGNYSLSVYGKFMDLKKQ